MRTERPMPDFEQGRVIRVPFPYTDRNTRQYRPALVVSRGGLGAGQAFLWVVMITSAENRHWPDDVSFNGRHADAGLPAPSIIRPAKIATIEARYAETIGAISPELMAAVAKVLQRNLGYA